MSTGTNQRLITDGEEYDHHEPHEDDLIRDIHALTSPDHPPHPTSYRSRRNDPSWSSQSTAASEGASSSENFTTMSREFNALVLAGSAISGAATTDGGHGGGGNDLGRIREEDQAPPEEETNPLAIVPDRSSTTSPLDPDRSPGLRRVGEMTSSSSLRGSELMLSSSSSSLRRVKEEEVEAKITAWQTAKLAQINNRFKREDAVINGWEGEKVQKATSSMKKVERKLEEKRARAMEKMQNEVAKAQRKADERRASAEAKRGTKVANVLELANLMRAVGRPPVKRSFFY